MRKSSGDVTIAETLLPHPVISLPRHIQNMATTRRLSPAVVRGNPSPDRFLLGKNSGTNTASSDRDVTRLATTGMEC